VKEIGWSGADIGAMEDRIGEWGTCYPPEPGGCWTLEHVAARPGWRRRGLTRAAIERVLERGRAFGFRQAKVDVFRGNAAARALYESFGFRISETFGAEVFARLLQRDALERFTMQL
jgi:GNAT superfamily N-acetyltransferase